MFRQKKLESMQVTGFSTTADPTTADQVIEETLKKRKPDIEYVAEFTKIKFQDI
jgi:hypothetical protein